MFANLLDVLPVCVYHEVPVADVDLGVLALVLPIEELWQGALLDGVKGAEIKEIMAT